MKLQLEVDLDRIAGPPVGKQQVAHAIDVRYLPETIIVRNSTYHINSVKLTTGDPK